MSLIIENDGPRIVATNYWDLPAARAGKVLVSINAGAFRVLLPPALEPALADMATARECVVSRGPWPGAGLRDALEILFDDGSDSPYALHLAPESFDRLPTAENAGLAWILSAWTQPRRGVPHKALERPCYYRIVDCLPYLKPRGQ